MSVWRIMVAVNKSVRIFLVHLNAHATTDCKSIPQTMRNVLVSSKWVSIYFAILLIQENVFIECLFFGSKTSPLLQNNLFSN